MAIITEVDPIESADSVHVRLNGKEHNVHNVNLMTTYLELLNMTESIKEFNVETDRERYPAQVRKTYQSVLGFLQALMPGAPCEELSQMAYVQVIYLLKNLIIEMETKNPSQESSVENEQNNADEYNLRIISMVKS